MASSPAPSAGPSAPARLDRQRIQHQSLHFPRTSIFQLQGVADDPDYVQAFVQAVMEEYVNLKKEMREQTSDTTLASLTDEVGRLELELRKGEQNLVHFQSSNSVVFLQEQGNSAGSRLAALNSQVRNAEVGI